MCFITYPLTNWPDQRWHHWMHRSHRHTQQLRRCVQCQWRRCVRHGVDNYRHPHMVLPSQCHSCFYHRRSEGVPVVEEFGLPAANFQGSCILDGHFFNMSLVFNIDFCGQYAGNVWQANGCPMLNPEDVITTIPPHEQNCKLTCDTGLGKLQHVRRK